MFGNILFWNEVVIPLAGMAVGVVLGLPIIKVIVRRIDHKPGSRAEAADLGVLGSELAELRGRLNAAEDLAGRVAELEERADFAERFLTQHRESGRLGPG